MLCLAILIAGCGSSPPAEYQRPQGSLMGLQGQEGPFWEDWESRDVAPMEVDIEGQDVTVFDGWGIEDRATRHRLWNQVFAVLSRLRHQGSDEANSPGVASVLMRLEYDLDETHWEIAFFSAADGQQEGAVLRIVSPDGVGLWLEAARPAGGPSVPTRWVLRVEPAAREAPGYAWWWHADEEHGWMLAGAQGAAADAPDAAAFTPAEAWAPYLDGLVDQWWRAITERQYLEPSFPITDPWHQDPTGHGWAPTLGAEVQERHLKDFVDDTLFVPRSDSLDLDL